MATDVVMPRLSDSMEEGTILRWMKQTGDEVSVGEELVEIETDKANMVHESDVAGTLIEITASAGDALPIGAVIARVGEPGEAPQGNGGGATRVKASPIARRLAREHGVDLAAITGSGAGGRITKADVEGLLAQSPNDEGALSSPRPEGPPAPHLSPAPAGEASAPRGSTETVGLTKVQQAVARRMAESKATAPHFHLDTEVDMSRAVAARAALKTAAREDEAVPSFNDMVVKACALVLREHPRANGAYRDGKLELYSRVNIGVAVAAHDALVVPTIFDADRKGLREIARESRSLAQRVRDGSITPPELAGGTFTVSNLGMYGVSSFQPVINPPQAGILAVGAIAERPVASDGEIALAHVVRLNLACDHRILYGADGAVLLGQIKALLEEPAGLAL